MRYLIFAFLVLLPACVSSKLANANLKSVGALGAVAVEVDPQNEPEAQAAVDNAEAIVEATGILPQITHLGVPEDIVIKNSEHVETLATAVAPQADDPKVRMTVTQARDNAAELSGKARENAQWRAHLPVGIPWVDTAIQAIVTIGSAVGALYGVTRGQKHVRAWWSEPGKNKVARPPAAPSDPKPVS